MRMRSRRGLRGSGVRDRSPAESGANTSLTLGALQESDLADAIAFLDDRAGDALRQLGERDRGGGEQRPDTALARGPVPGEHDPARVHFDAVEQSAPELRLLRAQLHDYADRIEPVNRSDVALLAATDALRLLMEGVYRQTITFDGEPRVAEDAEVEWGDRLERARMHARATLPDEQSRVETWDVRNLTADSIDLERPGRPAYIVPAFGSRRLEHDPQSTFSNMDELVARNRIEVTPNRTADQTALLAVLGFEFLLVPVFVVVALIWGDGSWWLIGAAVLVAAPLLIYLRRQKWVRRTLWGAMQGAPRRAMNLASLLLVLLFAVGLPAVTIYLGADLHDVFERASAGPVTDGGSDDLTLLARAMQLLFISGASMLPGLLYFQFDRERLGTIWEKFTRHVFRLDRRVTTEPELLAKYGFLMEEVFGRRRVAGHGRLLPGKLSPIVIATIVIVLGWLLTLLNPEIGEISSGADVVSLFQPHESAVTFAFLGAYVYALGAVLRGYVRRDLRPKSYTDITIRILTVVALAWLLQVFFPEDAPTLLVFAFATGLVPQTAFTLLREAVQGAGAAKDRGLQPTQPAQPSQPARSSDDAAVAELDSDPLPLTRLEGIDLYDRARLASEGITNIEALAHSDLIELMVQTRIPAPRLVDWVDQSILYLHVPHDDVVPHPDGEERLSSLGVLRRYGIRNATDLLRAAEKSEKDKGKAESSFVNILGPAQNGRPPRLSVIRDAIEDEEWMCGLMYWRSHDDVAADGTLSECGTPSSWLGSPPSVEPESPD